MKWICAMLLAVCAIARADIPEGWSTDVSASAFKGKPGLLFFTASWCGPCKMMARTTLTDAKVKQAIAPINHVAIDIDQHPELAATYNVEAVPTFIILTSDGVEVERTTGYEPAADFMAWLNGSVAEAQKIAEQRDAAKVVLKAADDLLAATGSGSLSEAAGKLYPLCDFRDASIVKAAEDRLRAIAEREPAALLDGLNDAELATRIRVANVLEGKLGVEVDPWSDEGTREKEIEGIRERK